MNLVKVFSAAFLAANLGAVALNMQSFAKIDMDSKSINLAGRQRMLSQKMTKASLVAAEQKAAAGKHEKAMAELVGAAQLFDSTLRAFVDGGATTSAEGKEVTLKALSGKSREFAVQALARWDSVSGPLLTENGDPAKARDNLMAANAELLDLMNKMTVAIESASKDSVESMKMVQYALFALAVLLGIVVFVSLRAEAKESADQTGSLYAAMDEVAAGVLVLDGAGKIRHHNKAALIFLSMEGGASPIGKPMAALMEETNTPGLWKVARSGKPTHSVHVSTSEPIDALNGLRVATLFHSGLK